MIRPEAHALLDGLAASLEETVLPELARGPARRQLQSAIAILRRIAFAAPRMADAIEADNRAMAEALSRIAALSGTAMPIPETADPAARHLALQEALADVQESLGRLSPSTRGEADAVLHDLFRGMAERQMTLIPPGRKPLSRTELRDSRI